MPKVNILDNLAKDLTTGKEPSSKERNPAQITLDKPGNYSIGQFTYPENLTGKADLQHYVAFYINVRGKTKFKSQKILDVDVSTGTNNLSAEGMQSTATGTAVIGAALAGGASADKALAAASATKRSVLNGIDVKKLGSKSSKAAAAIGLLTKSSSFKSLAVGTAAGAATYGAFKIAGAFVDALKEDRPERISDAIVLHIEKPPEVKYSMKYGELNFGILGGLLGGGSSAIETSGSSRIGEAGAAIGLAVANLPKAAIAGQLLGAIPSPKQAFLAGAKAQTNPFREVIFEAVNPRSFNFTYTFLPRSQEEVYRVKSIIDLFKFHMHPELSAGGLFYIYPSEFEIVYYYRGKENTFVNKISKCVLSDMSVKYGGDYFSTFEDGSPAEISMTLSFQELEIMTKERIVKGY